jgi:hypothetical protein
VALSSTEAEFVATTHAAKEAIWLKQFITKVFLPLQFPMKLFSDNQLSIAIIYGNQQHARTKHFDICLYFIWDAIEMDKIAIEYLPTEQMLADIL